MFKEKTQVIEMDNSSQDSVSCSRKKETVLSRIFPLRSKRESLKDRLEERQRHALILDSIFDPFRMLSIAVAMSVSLSFVGPVDAKKTHDQDPNKQDQIEISNATAVSDKIKIAKKDKSDDSKKGAADEKDSKSGKDKVTEPDKDKNKDKSKSDSKAENKDDRSTDAKKDSKTEPDSDKKKGGGLFHLGGGKKKDKDDEAADSKSSDKDAVKKAETEKASKPAAPEDPNKPKYKFDPALISVLKDINKSLKDSDAVTKLEDPTQKLVAKLAGQALDKALSAPELHANRIVEAKDKERMEASMSAEAWESGNLEPAPDFKAAVVALWAKKIDGLLTVEIVGNYDGKPEGSEERLGEFIAVITARSSVDKGFDIQSQQDVNFWIGKVADLKIDCSKAGADKNQKSLLQLYIPLTQRKREFVMALKEYEDRLAKADEDKKKQSDISAAVAAQQKQVAEALAKTVAEALAKSVNNRAGDSQQLTANHEPSTGGIVGEKKSEGSSELNAGNNQTSSEAPKQTSGSETSSLVPGREQAQTVNASTGGGVSNSVQNPVPAVGTGTARPSTVASLFPESSRNSRSNWDSPSGPTQTRMPSSAAALLFPGRAVAGQYLTVAVLGLHNTGEPYVGLSFNGAQLVTADNGRVVYQVPDDAPPGFSMHVGLTGRPEEAPGAIEILQPLASPTSPQIPNLENVSPVCGGGGIVTLAGHNFDGIAERNRVIIDGAYDANVIVSSPVQLKAQLPQGIAAGPHSLCVSTAGLRSNPGNFDLVVVDLSPGGPDTPKNDLKKLMVKVSGTHNKVRVKLVNQSRDVIKLVKGDEVVVVTSGGPQNQVFVPVQRLRWGEYKIDAEILI